MALRTKPRNTPELLPHFCAGAACCTVAAAWQMLGGPLQIDVQFPEQLVMGLVYWFICTGLLFAVMLAWDCWVVPRARRCKGGNVPAAIMIGLALALGFTIPFFANAF